jgi:hypothetical protein
MEKLGRMKASSKYPFTPTQMVDVNLDPYGSDEEQLHEDALERLALIGTYNTETARNGHGVRFYVGQIVVFLGTIDNGRKVFRVSNEDGMLRRYGFITDIDHANESLALTTDFGTTTSVVHWDLVIHAYDCSGKYGGVRESVPMPIGITERGLDYEHLERKVEKRRRCMMECMPVAPVKGTLLELCARALFRKSMRTMRQDGCEYPEALRKTLCPE